MPDATTNAYGVSHFDPVGLSMFTVRCNSVTSTCCAIALDTSEKVGTTDLTSAAKQMAVSQRCNLQTQQHAVPVRVHPLIPTTRHNRAMCSCARSDRTEAADCSSHCLPLLCNRLQARVAQRELTLPHSTVHRFVRTASCAARWCRWCARARQAAKPMKAKAAAHQSSVVCEPFSGTPKPATGMIGRAGTVAPLGDTECETA